MTEKEFLRLTILILTAGTTTIATRRYTTPLSRPTRLLQTNRKPRRSPGALPGYFSASRGRRRREFSPILQRMNSYIPDHTVCSWVDMNSTTLRNPSPVKTSIQISLPKNSLSTPSSSAAPSAVPLPHSYSLLSS